MFCDEICRLFIFFSVHLYISFSLLLVFFVCVLVRYDGHVCLVTLILIIVVSEISNNIQSCCFLPVLYCFLVLCVDRNVSFVMMIIPTFPRLLISHLIILMGTQ